MADRGAAFRNRIVRAARRLPSPLDESATAFLRYLRALSRRGLPVSTALRGSRAQPATPEFWSENAVMEIEELRSQIASLAARLEKTEKLTVDVARSLEYSMIEIRELQRDNPSTRPEDQL